MLYNSGKQDSVSACDVAPARGDPAVALFENHTGVWRHRRTASEKAPPLRAARIEPVERDARAYEIARPG